MVDCVNLNFRASPLPIPPAEYSPEHFRQLIRVIELYFSQSDSWNLQVYNALQELCMDPLPISIGGTNVDAFGRLRVSQPFTLFDSQNRYAADNQFDVATTGTGTTTFLSNEAAIKMEVTSGGVGSVTRQSFRSFPYQPGKGLTTVTSTSSFFTERRPRRS